MLVLCGSLRVKTWGLLIRAFISKQYYGLSLCGSEKVRFLMGTQNFFFVPCSRYDKKKTAFFNVMVA